MATTKQKIDRLIRENQSRLYGYNDALNRGATYLNLVQNWQDGIDICHQWRAAYQRAVAHARYVERKNRTSSLPNTI